jgi:hypothetical protein
MTIRVGLVIVYHLGSGFVQLQMDTGIAKSALTNAESEPEI